MATFTPGPRQPNSRDIRPLNQPKKLAELFDDAWALWRGQPGVFLVTAAVVVIPFYVIVVGLIGGGFHDSLGKPSPGVQLLQLIVLGTFGTAMITAIHARAVVAISEGKVLSTESAFNLGRPVFGGVILAALLYLGSVVGGLILIVFPGIYVAIAGMFTTEYAAIEGMAPVEALKASVRLVRQNGWWRTFGYQFVLALVGSLGSVVAGLLIGVVSAASGHSPTVGYFAVPVLAIVDAAVMSWTALVLTLLFFSWRAQSDDPYGGPLPVTGEQPGPPAPQHDVVTDGPVGPAPPTFIPPGSPRPPAGPPPGPPSEPPASSE
jgi:hypothetical protein